MAQLTRIAVGGVGRTYGTVTDKLPGTPPTRPGDIFTRIGVGGVGAHYLVLDKAETDIIDPHTPGYYGVGVKRPKNRDEEIIALIMAMYETGTF